MRQNNPTKTRILDRTLYLIGKKGTSDVSIREIAKEADVNVAAINYYFTTKDQMFSQMEELFFGRFSDVMALLYDESKDAETRLQLWADEIMLQLLKYPGIVVLLSEKVDEEEQDDFGKSAARVLDQMRDKIKELISQIVVTKDEEEIRFKATVLTSTIVQPVALFGTKGYTREYFTKAENRTRFIQYLMDVIKR